MTTQRQHDLMRPQLPIIKSFVNPIALDGLIEQNYDLPGVRSQLIKATMRDVYHVRTPTAQYVAMLYPAHRTANHIRSELALMTFLSQKGMRTTPPIAQRNGDKLLAIHTPEGTRHLVMYAYVSGVIYRRPTLPNIQQYAEAIARLHTLTNEFTFPYERMVYDVDTLIHHAMDVITDVLWHRPDVVEDLGDLAARIAPILATLPQTAPRFGVIHGDVIPSNAMFTPENIMTLIDFDLCGVGWRVYDVATYLNEIAYWQMGEEAAIAFLNTYNKKLSLAPQDRELLPVFQIARHIFEISNAALHIDVWGREFGLSDHILNGIMANVNRCAAIAPL